MLILAIAALGLGGIIAGVWAIFYMRPLAGRGGNSRRWRKMQLACYGLGVILGIGSWPVTFWMGYPYATAQGPGRAVGIPFFVAWFDSAGRDYVGPLTVPGALANAVFWFLLPQLVLAIVWHYRARANDPGGHSA